MVAPSVRPLAQESMMSLVPLFAAVVALATLCAGFFVSAALSLTDPDEELDGFSREEDPWGGWAA